MKRMRRREKYTLILLVVLLILLSAYLIWNLFKQDRKPPEIIFSDQSITYHSNDNRSVLLNGVTAMDETDGDVTSYLIVKRVQVSEDKTKATVYYIACDRSGNMAYAQRKVDYLDNDSYNDSIYPLNVEGLPLTIQAGKPELTLKTSSIELSAGTAFDPISNVESIKASSNQAVLVVSNLPDTGIPGKYGIRYYVKGTDEAISAFQYMVLTVTAVSTNP